MSILKMLVDNIERDLIQVFNHGSNDKVLGLRRFNIVIDNIQVSQVMLEIEWLENKNDNRTAIINGVKFKKVYI